MDEALLAGIHLEVILSLMENLAAHDPISKRAVAGRRRVVQFEVKKGAAAHLVIADGTIVHEPGKHPRPDILLVFKNDSHLNSVFSRKEGRPRIRKGYRHLWFMLRKFPVLDRRLTYFLEGEGKTDPDADAGNMVVRLGLRAMLGGMAFLAANDSTLRRTAQQTPAGTLLIRVEPDGPYGTFEKIDRNGAFEFRSTFCRPVASPDAEMIFSGPEAARDLITGRLNAVTAIGMGTDIRIRGLLPLIEKAGIYLYRFGRIMNKEGA